MRSVEWLEEVFFLASVVVNKKTRATFTQLTIIGRLMRYSDTFRPKLFAMQPNTIFAAMAPIDSNDVTHDASSIVILPLGNGVASDVKRTFIGLVHPSNNPNPMINKFTEQETATVQN